MTLQKYSNEMAQANGITHIVLAYDSYVRWNELLDSDETIDGWKAYMSPGEPSGGGFPIGTSENDNFTSCSVALDALKRAGWSDEFPVYAYVPSRIGTYSGEDTIVKIHDPNTPPCDVLYEDHFFTVTKNLEDQSVCISFIGDDGIEEVTVGSSYYLDAAAKQIEDILNRAGTDEKRRQILEKRTGIKPSLSLSLRFDWLDNNTKGDNKVIKVEDLTIHMTLVRAKCGEEEWWVQTFDSHSNPAGDYANPTLFESAHDARLAVSDSYEAHHQLKNANVVASKPPL